MAMELAEGGTLEDYMRERKHYPSSPSTGLGIT